MSKQKPSTHCALCAENYLIVTDFMLQMYTVVDADSFYAIVSPCKILLMNTRTLKQATFGALRFLCCKYVNINKAKKYLAALS